MRKRTPIEEQVSYGNVFGRLTVVGGPTRFTMENGEITPKWTCLCECGNEVIVRHQNLINKNTQSCGCYHRYRTSVTSTTHGHSRNGKITKEFGIWRGMKQRCYDPNCLAYIHYGGRGIKMCDRWLDSFENFYADMGARPSQDHSIDRIDVNGDYCPENCKWSTRIEQQRNKRNNVFLSFNGETHCVSEWAKMIGVSPHIISQRNKNGWEMERIFKFWGSTEVAILSMEVAKLDRRLAELHQIIALT